MNETFAANTTNKQFGATIDQNAGFNPSSNYSWVWFRESDTITADANALKGKTVQFYLQLYPEHGCQDTPDQPNYGLSCGSDKFGDCHQTSYNVQSFSVHNSSYEMDGKCVNFYQQKSAASNLGPRSWSFLAGVAVLAAFVLV